MKRMLFSFAMVFVLVMFTSWAWAAEQEPEALEDIIEEERWIFFMDEPAGYLLEAREDFLNGDLQGAAQNIRAGTVIIKIETHRAKGEAKKALNASAGGLKKLAKAIEKGSVASGRMLEEAFAQAEYSLARHHYQRALDYEAKGDYEKKAYAVDAAATHLLYASFWAGDGLEEDDVVAIKEGRSIAKKLIRGARWGPKKMDLVVKSIDRGIQKLGMKINPQKAEPD